jgi:hypothetical protein
MSSPAAEDEGKACAHNSVDAIDEISNDGIMELLLAGGQDALLGQWLQQVISLMGLHPDFLPRSLRCDSSADMACDEESVLRVCRGLHKALADIAAADQLEQIIGSESQLQTAPLVLTFLAGQMGKAEGGFSRNARKRSGDPFEDSWLA